MRHSGETRNPVPFPTFIAVPDPWLRGGEEPVDPTASFEGTGSGTKRKNFLLFMRSSSQQEDGMGRGLLLWLIGVPIPIILLIWFLGGLS